MAKIPGPPPKAARRRRNADIMQRLQGERRGKPSDIVPDPKWMVPVRNYFKAALHSGQSDFYESSDVMTLYIHCELLDRILRGSRTVPVYVEEKNEEGNYVPVIDEEGQPIPELDDHGEPMRRTLGNVNGQALKAVLDQGADLLLTEGARRKLRIELITPNTDDEAPEKAIVAKQRRTVAAVKR